MHWILPITFWTAVALVVYTHCGYPLLIAAAARLAAPRDRRRPRAQADAAPTVTVLIAAYNAAQHIDARIDNLLACDYPRARLRILIASDGSTDATAERVRERQDPRVTVAEFPERRGKAATLADAVEHIASDVVVFTDASTCFQPDSLWRLTRHFADPAVGIVTGKAGIVDATGEPIEAIYWRQEMRVRRCEARLGILLGASGAIYAIRRSIFVAPLRPVINDDLVLPMLAHLEHGGRFIFDESARAYVSHTGGLRQEFRRRCRIGAGAYQALTVLSPLLNPRHIRHAFAFVSHKLLRWLCPFLLLLAAGSNLGLLGHPLYDLLFGTQAILYTMAALGVVIPGCGPAARLMRLMTSFCAMNLALLAGFFRWVSDSQNATWNPTPRPHPAAIPLAAHTSCAGTPRARYAERTAV